MNTREQVTAWLEEGIGAGFEPRDDGVYSFETPGGGRVTVEAPQDGGVFHLHAPICSLPEEGQGEHFYAGVLKLNLLCIETRGATLALDDRGGRIVLCYGAALAGMDALGFANLLGSFVESADEVRRKVTALGQVEASRSSAPDPGREMWTGLRA
jgi:hypothetical protein